MSHVGDLLLLRGLPTADVIALLGHVNARVRNQAAVELMERPKAPEIFEALVSCLRDPMTKGSRGTIVYALYERGYDCSSILLDLAECFLSGSFEETVHAADIVCGMADDLPATAAEFRARLRAYNDGGWRAEAIEEVLTSLT